MNSCQLHFRMLLSKTFLLSITTNLSDVAYLVSGVVQGSGIGPLMFLIYLNELIAILENHGIRIKVFADDVKMYIVNEVDIHKLQSALAFSGSLF